jgi:hypothetical protein
MKKIIYILLLFVSCNTPQYEDVYAQVSLSYTNTISTGSASASTQVRPSTNFTAGRLYLLFVSNAKATTPQEATVTGTSQTWTKVTGLTFNTTASPTQRLTVYRFYATSTFSATTSIAFGSTQLHINSILREVTGMKTTGTNGADAIGVSSTNSGDGTANPTVTTGAFTNGSSAAIAFFGNTANPFTGTAESGWTEDSDVGFSSPTRGVYIMSRLATTDNTATVTAAASDWGGIALEIKAAVTRRIITSN